MLPPLVAVAGERDKPIGERVNGLSDACAGMGTPMVLRGKFWEFKEN
jgi:hypothetical protein